MTEAERYFIFKTIQGLKALGLHTDPKYIKRLEYELDIILTMGFSGYFLIVQDFIQNSKDNNVYVGPGRGSGAGSLVCYCLDITKLDPLVHGLFFERFLNPARISMPDLDIDIECQRREQVIDYLRQRYGEDKVAHISTFNNRRAKAAVKDAARILGHPAETGAHLSGLLLPPLHGKPQKLADSIKRVPELKEFALKPGTNEADILYWAGKLEDLVTAVGVHASGIVIGNTALEETVPLFRGNDGQVVAQWSMDDVEAVGLIKFDLLGLDALSKIHDCIDIIKKHHDIDLDIYELPQDDAKTYASLRSGDTVGNFQVESSGGIKELMIQIRPENLSDLAALVAIYRPGPLASDYKDTYLRVRAGELEPTYLVPELEPILAETSGWCIYQEQPMRIARDLCGYTLAEADNLRKAIGKKKADLMATHETKFKNGWIEHGLPLAEVNVLWDTIVSFASYAFNKAHAAVYGYITYITAYLKTHYPTEYMCAIMSSEGVTHDDMIKFITDAKQHNISVLPPDINESGLRFEKTNTSEIRFGLQGIKNVGDGARQLLEEREKYGKFRDFDNFLIRVASIGLNKTKITSLILAGAFDSMGFTRAGLLQQVDAFISYVDLTKRHQKKMQTFHKRQDAFNKRLMDINQGSKKKSLKMPVAPEMAELPQIQNLTELSRLEIQKAEHDLLGLYVTSHPLEGLPSAVYAGAMPNIESLPNVSRKQVILVGVIATKQEILTRKKQKMAVCTLEDMSGSLELVLFAKSYETLKEFTQPGTTIIVKGALDVTETEEGIIKRLRVWAISSLENIMQSENYNLYHQKRTIPVEVPMSRAYEAAKYMSPVLGGDGDAIELKVKGSIDTSFSFGKIRIKKIHRVLAQIDNLQMKHGFFSAT